MTSSGTISIAMESIDRYARFEVRGRAADMWCLRYIRSMIRMIKVGSRRIQIFDKD